MRKVRFLSVILAIVCLVGFASINLNVASEVKAETAWELHYWNFDDSLNDVHGTLNLNGDAVYDEGKNGKALNTADMSSAPRTEKLTIDTLNGYTMGGWIYLNEDASGFQILMSTGNTGSADSDRIQIHLSDSSTEAGGGYITVYCPATTGAAYPDLYNDPECTAARLVAYNTWVHVATTWNGNVAKVFVNGVKIYEVEITGQLSTAFSDNKKITVGALQDGATFKFDGLIDDAFYANYAMTEADIATAAGADGAAALKGWADGSKTFTPDEMKDRTQETPDTSAPEESDSTSGTLFFWPFDDDYVDMSHNEFDFDYEEMYPGFDEGKVGQAVLLEDASICTDSFAEDLDLSEFTLAFWMRFDGVPNALPYYIVCALGDKAQSHHFEVYLTSSDCENAALCVYNTGTSDKQGICTIEAGEYYNVVITNGTASGLNIYVNGELAYCSKNIVKTEGLADGYERFTLGSLQDYSLPCYGAYDELILANYVLSSDLIAKLYSDPQGAHDDLLAICKENAPEGYARATAKPTAEPTQAPTQAPATEVPADPTVAPATKAPADNKTETEAQSGNNAAIVIIAIAAAVVVAIVVAIIVILKKKK